MVHKMQSQPPSFIFKCSNDSPYQKLRPTKGTHFFNQNDFQTKSELWKPKACIRLPFSHHDYIQVSVLKLNIAMNYRLSSFHKVNLLCSLSLLAILLLSILLLILSKCILLNSGVNFSFENQIKITYFGYAWYV